MGFRGWRLKGLRVDEVSGVDRPATGEPFLLMKSEGEPDPSDAELAALVKELTQEEPMPTLEDALAKADIPEGAKPLADALLKALKGEPSETVAKADHDNAVKAEKDRADRAEAALKALSGHTDPVDPEADALAKAMDTLPEPVRKMIEATNARLAEAEKVAKDERDARLSREYLEKAQKITGLAASPETVATLLRKAEQGEPLTKADAAEFERVLKAAGEAAKNPTAFKELGGAGADVSDGEAAIAKAADDLQKADPNLSRASALVKAADLVHDNGRS